MEITFIKAILLTISIVLIVLGVVLGVNAIMSPMINRLDLVVRIFLSVTSMTIGVIGLRELKNEEDIF